MKMYDWKSDKKGKCPKWQRKKNEWKQRKQMVLKGIKWNERKNKQLKKDVNRTRNASNLEKLRKG